MITEFIKDRFNSLKEYKKSEHHWIDHCHILGFCVGTNEIGWDEILISTVNEPPELKSGNSLETSKKIGVNGRWHLIISSVKPENQDLFVIMCLDLFESSQDSISEKAGLIFISDRYAAWQKIFQAEKGVLRDSLLKELLGELYFTDKYQSVLKKVIKST